MRLGALTKSIAVETARFLGKTLDTQLTWSAHVNQVGKKAAQRLGVLGPSLIRQVACPSETTSLLDASRGLNKEHRGPLCDVDSKKCKRGKYFPQWTSLFLLFVCTSWNEGSGPRLKTDRKTQPFITITEVGRFKISG
jgi:hypothetical protein